MTAEIYARRKWNNILKICKKRKCEQKVLYLIRLTQIVINMQELEEIRSHGPLLKYLQGIKSTPKGTETLTQELLVSMKRSAVEPRLNEG